MVLDQVDELPHIVRQLGIPLHQLPAGDLLHGSAPAGQAFELAVKRSSVLAQSISPLGAAGIDSSHGAAMTGTTRTGCAVKNACAHWQRLAPLLKPSAAASRYTLWQFAHASLSFSAIAITVSWFRDCEALYASLATWTRASVYCL